MTEFAGKAIPDLDEDLAPADTDRYPVHKDGELEAKSQTRSQIVRWNDALKETDETRSSTVVVAPDAELLVAMLANTKYAIRGGIIFETVAAADFRWNLAGPAAITYVAIHRRDQSGSGSGYAVNNMVHALPSTEQTPSQSNDDSGIVLLDGLVYNGANAGNFAFQWAQQTSNAGLTTVKAGSYLQWRVIG